MHRPLAPLFRKRDDPGEQDEPGTTNATGHGPGGHDWLLDLISGLAQSFGTARDMQGVFSALHSFTAGIAPCDELSVALFDAELGTRSCVFAMRDGREVPHAELCHWPLSGGCEKDAAPGGDVEAAAPRCANRNGRAHLLALVGDPSVEHSSLVVPMAVLGRVIGEFEVRSSQPHAFTSEHLSAMRMAANLAAVAIENVQLLDREREAQRRFQTLVENVPAMAYRAIYDRRRTILYASEHTEELTGYSAGQFVAGEVDFSAIVLPEDRGLLWTTVQEAVQARKPFKVGYRIRHKDGQARWVYEIGRPVESEDGQEYLEGTISDDTSRKNLEAQLEHQAFHDPLTGLPNRTLFLDRLRHAVRHAERLQGSTAVLFLDLDRFKVVNDSLGHAAGDRLLIEVARRLSGCLRPGDTAARLGGDEFTVLLEHITHVRGAIGVAERIIARLQSPFMLDGQEVFISTSIGIAVGQGRQSSGDDLMRFADIAMYRAKNSGRAHYEVFDQNMPSETLQRLQMETDLRRALERGEFRIHYQPKVLLETGRIVGMEALLRWQHPQRGLVSPAEFIPLAEETGLILPIGQWVLQEATRQARRWQDTYPNARALVISVNLSARQFQQRMLAFEIARALQESGLLPARLNLELTESILMEDAEATINTLKQLKHLGVHLSIDDFGTGYSSLSYLKRFPVDMLKISQSFVKGLGEDRGDAAIVRAVITLARTLGMIVTAEGVETAAQLAYLRAVGCDLAQGYYFARPMDAEKAGELLARGMPEPEAH